MKVLVHFLLSFFIAQAAFADSTVSYRTIRVVGRSESVVTSPHLKLSDVADITSPRSEDDEAVLALRHMQIGTSPAPGMSQPVYGETLLGIMRREGVNLEHVVYSFPRELKVTRAYREISLDEIEHAVKAFVDGGGRDMQVKHIDYKQPFRVAPDAKPIQAISVKAVQPGQVGIDLSSATDEGEARFQLKAMVDDWRMIPVAKRRVPKGVAIAGADIEMRSFNSALLPKDILDDPADVIGTVTTRDIGEGEPLKHSMVMTPPLIATGAHVFIAVRSGLLEATATGTALDSGFKGQEIRVRNESSKKILSAVIEDAGMVRVGGGTAQ